MNRLNVARCAVTMAVLLAGAFGAPVASAKSAPDSKSQIAFGVDMAKRGLWSEALFRFEQAKLLKPQNVSILNNLAICYEAGGRFEEALATYREALSLAPGNRVVKQNYSRFAEFYQGFRPRKAAAAVTAPAAVAPAPAGDAAAEPPPPAVAPPADPGSAPAEAVPAPPPPFPSPAPGSLAPGLGSGGGK